MTEGKKKKKKAKKKAGRPIEFKPTDEDIIDIGIWAGNGLTTDDIADKLGISPATFFRHKASQDKIMRAYKKGRKERLNRIAQKVADEAEAGDMTAAIFYLKTQGRWRTTDNEKPVVQQTFNADNQTTIHVTKDRIKEMSIDELDKLVNGHNGNGNGKHE